MKQLLTILFLSVSLVVRLQAQWGDVFEPVQVYSDTWNLMINKAGYDGAPTLIFVPGAGEIGSTNGTDSSKIYAWGPNVAIMNGWKGYVRGEKWNIITLQPRSGSTNAAYYNRAIDSIIARYKPDTCRIYYTALSLGASVFARTIATYSGGRYWKPAAVVLMSVGSTATLDSIQQLKAFAQYGGRYYGIRGNNDVTRTLTGDFADYINSVSPGAAIYEEYTHDGGGHGGWNTEYDTTTKRNGIENIYEWLGKFSKRPYAKAPTNFSTSDSSITLNGIVDSISGGYNGRGRTITWSKVSGGAATITSPNSDTTTVTGLSAGVYVFKLRSENASGGLYSESTVTVTITGSEAGYPLKFAPKMSKPEML